MINRREHTTSWLNCLKSWMIFLSKGKTNKIDGARTDSLIPNENYDYPLIRISGSYITVK